MLITAVVLSRLPELKTVLAPTLFLALQARSPFSVFVGSQNEMLRKYLFEEVWGSSLLYGISLIIKLMERLEGKRTES